MPKIFFSCMMELLARNRLCTVLAMEWVSPSAWGVPYSPPFTAILFVPAVSLMVPVRVRVRFKTNAFPKRW